MKHVALWACALLALSAAPALAQQGTANNPTRTLDMNAPLPDGTISNNGAFQGFEAMTDGVTYTARRSVEFICTTAGYVVETGADGTTKNALLQVGDQSRADSITKWTVTAAPSPAAVCPYVYNLK